jgi:hypothetical protein
MPSYSGGNIKSDRFPVNKTHVITNNTFVALFASKTRIQNKRKGGNLDGWNKNKNPPSGEFSSISPAQRHVRVI